MNVLPVLARVCEVLLSLLQHRPHLGNAHAGLGVSIDSLGEPRLIDAALFAQRSLHHMVESVISDMDMDPATLAEVEEAFIGAGLL